MVAKERESGFDTEGVACHIASRLSHSYGWVDRDDLAGYAQLGVTMAIRRFRPDCAVPLAVFAFRKGTFLAIDEMRKDGVLRRRGSQRVSMPSALPEEVADPSGGQDHRQMILRDQLGRLLGRLAQGDRQLLMMYYSQHMTFREIATVYEITESAVSLRHKTLLARLRRLAGQERSL